MRECLRAQLCDVCEPDSQAEAALARMHQASIGGLTGAGALKRARPAGGGDEGDAIAGSPGGAPRSRREYSARPPTTCTTTMTVVAGAAAARSTARTGCVTWGAPRGCSARPCTSCWLPLPLCVAPPPPPPPQRRQPRPAVQKTTASRAARTLPLPRAAAAARCGMAMGSSQQHRLNSQWAGEPVAAAVVGPLARASASAAAAASAVRCRCRRQAAPPPRRPPCKCRSSRWPS